MGNIFLKLFNYTAIWTKTKNSHQILKAKNNNKWAWINKPRCFNNFSNSCKCKTNSSNRIKTNNQITTKNINSINNSNRCNTHHLIIHTSSHHLQCSQPNQKATILIISSLSVSFVLACIISTTNSPMECTKIKTKSTKDWRTNCIRS